MSARHQRRHKTIEHCSGQATGIDNKKNTAHFRKLKRTFRVVEDVMMITAAGEMKYDGSCILGLCLWAGTSTFSLANGTLCLKHADEFRGILCHRRVQLCCSLEKSSPDEFL